MIKSKKAFATTANIRKKFRVTVAEKSEPVQEPKMALRLEQIITLALLPIWRFALTRLIAKNYSERLDEPKCSGKF